MNTKEVTTTSTKSFYYPEVEEMIIKKSTELKEGAQKDAKHLAKENIPEKDAKTIAPYITAIKAGYEYLISEALQFLMASSIFLEAKMDADYYKETDKGLDEKIKNLEDANRHAVYELGKYSPGSILLLIGFAVIATVIINIGETLFTSKAFEVTGENMLFALILSVSVSF